MNSREAWLIAATSKLRETVFREVGHDIPTVRISVGFPGGGSARKRIGEYWHGKATQDGIPQIFISPVLTDAVEHLDTLVHELVHACTPGAGHGPKFKKLGLAVGLVGKPRSMGAGDALKEKLKALALELGEFPHAGVNLSDRKKQSTRMIKCECTHCGYTVRTSRSWIDVWGAPICPCSKKQMEVSQ